VKFVGGVLVMAAVACYLAPDSHAAGCAERSAAHIAEHGGLYADSAWHVANGELPTCGGNAEASRSYQNNTRSNNNYDNDSRFCERRWWC
jgi:hypothetical protein